MVFKQCFCDPFKLTYISGIVTAIEAVAFGTLNIVLILMNKCVIEPPKQLNSFEYFWAWYFYDDDECQAKEGYTRPGWTNVTFPLSDRPSHSTVDANLSYQISYLCLHSAWFISAFVLIYGNARKKWGYYIPWLLITLTLLIMDIVISAFYISDMVEVANTDGDYKGAMFWIMAMYFRIFIIWFVNLNKFASACNSFCKSYHKRSKQAKQQKKQQKKHELEMSEAIAKTEATIRAEYDENNDPPPNQPPPQLQHPPLPQEPTLQPTIEPAEPQLPPLPLLVPQERPVMYGSVREGVDVVGYGDPQPIRPKKVPPPVPKKPKAPPEARPFNYLNPTFRPADSHDLEGMRANAAFVPDDPTDILHRSRPTSMNDDEADYFPHDGYIKPWSSKPSGDSQLKRYDSMRNMRTQPQEVPLRRFSSTRGPPRTPYQRHGPPYERRGPEPPPDYDMTLGRPHHRDFEQRKPLPRVNASHSSSRRHDPYPYNGPPPSRYQDPPPRHYGPSPQRNPPPPRNEDIMYF